MTTQSPKTILWALAAVAVLYFVTRTAEPSSANGMIHAEPALAPGRTEYSDPNHPHCKRSIEVQGGTDAIVVSGTDGDPASGYAGCPPDGSGVAWQVNGSLHQDAIVVDFSPKGGPKDLTGQIVEGDIVWEDRNIWTAKRR